MHRQRFLEQNKPHKTVLQWTGGVCGNLAYHVDISYGTSKINNFTCYDPRQNQGFETLPPQRFSQIVDTFSM